MSLRLIAATGLATAALAAPAAAAPALDPLKPCYQSFGELREQRETVTVHGTGFTPMSLVDVLVDGRVELTGGQVDALGEVTARVSAPHQREGERPFTVTLAEQGNPANTASRSALVSQLTVALRPREAPSSQRVRIRGRGFTGPEAVYGHYLYVRPDGSRRHRRTVRFGRPAGTCGVFGVRRRQIPLRRPRTGLWVLQVDQQRDYAPEPASARVEVNIRVWRSFRTP